MSNKKIILFYMFLSFIGIEGCFDILSEDESHFVGSISLINSHNQEDKGYKMVIYEKEGFNANVLEDYIVDVKGNDSILIVKCIRKSDCNEIYYKISHDKGERPLKIYPIDLNTFLLNGSSFSVKYKFHNESYECP